MREERANPDLKIAALAHAQHGVVSLEPNEVRRAIRQAGVYGYRLGGVEADHTRSELEYLFLRLCRRHRLPAPEVNVRIGRFEVDFLWRESHLIVETDGYR